MYLALQKLQGTIQPYSNDCSNIKSIVTRIRADNSSFSAAFLVIVAAERHDIQMYGQYAPYFKLILSRQKIIECNLFDDM